MRSKHIVIAMAFDRADGLLLLYKPKGMTSHDCVQRVRQLFRTRKVGHAGTLDPDATGVLVIAINGATKILQFLEQDDKIYEAELAIGKSTSTEDASGEVLEVDYSYKRLTRQAIESVFQNFLGRQTQIPPLISAVKVKGKRLYEYARAKEAVERPMRTIEVHALTLLDGREVFEGEEITFWFRAHVSKGTYIRTLAKDIGQALGYPAHLKSLVRIQSGPFHLKDCLTFEDLEQGNVRLLTLKEALSSYKMITVDEAIKRRIIHGQKLWKTTEDDLVVFLDQQDHVLAVYGKDPNDERKWKPLRVLRPGEGEMVE